MRYRPTHVDMGLDRSKEIKKLRAKRDVLIRKIETADPTQKKQLASLKRRLAETDRDIESWEAINGSETQ